MQKSGIIFEREKMRFQNYVLSVFVFWWLAGLQMPLMYRGILTSAITMIFNRLDSSSFILKDNIYAYVRQNQRFLLEVGLLTADTYWNSRNGFYLILACRLIDTFMFFEPIVSTAWKYRKVLAPAASLMLSKQKPVVVRRTPAYLD